MCASGTELSYLPRDIGPLTNGINLRLQTVVHTYTYTNIHTCTHTSTNIHSTTHTHTDTHTHTHTHTHAHTHTRTHHHTMIPTNLRVSYQTNTWEYNRAVDPSKMDNFLVSVAVIGWWTTLWKDGPHDPHQPYPIPHTTSSPTYRIDYLTKPKPNQLRLCGHPFCIYVFIHWFFFCWLL